MNVSKLASVTTFAGVAAGVSQTPNKLEPTGNIAPPSIYNSLI